MTLSPTSWLIVAAIAAESMPPERNMPSGTSAISRRRTASRKRSPYSATTSASEALASSGLLSNERSQYCSIRIWPSFQRSVWPGSSRLTPANIVAAPEGAWLAR